MRFCKDLGLLRKYALVLPRLRHRLEVGNVVFDLGLGVLNIARFLHFHGFFKRFIVHPCLVFVLRHHRGMHVGLIRAARDAVLVKDHLAWQIFNWSLKPVRRQLRFGRWTATMAAWRGEL